MHIDDVHLRKALGRKLRELRIARGIPTLEKMSELTTLDDRYIGSIERGEKNPTYPTLIKYAKGLGLKNFPDLFINMNEDLYPVIQLGIEGEDSEE